MATITGADVVKRARSYIGQHEDPLGSNTGWFVQECQRATFLAGTGWPWCAAFVCEVCKALHDSLAPNNSAGAHDLANRHQPWVPASAVKPGMVVDYNIGSGHTGIVTAIDLHTGTVTSCDGNWSDAVVEHSMPLSEVRAFWAIPGVTYTTTPTPKPPVKKLPPFVVATSASGHRKILFTSPGGTAGKKSLMAWLTAHSLAKLAPNGVTITRGKA